MSFALNDPVAARTAGADALSLALIDARNHTLRWLAAFEGSAHGPWQPAGGLPGALWLAGHAGWWTEWWILRNVTAQRGEASDARRPRLGSIHPRADAAFHADRRAQAAQAAMPLPEPGTVRAYLADTMEATLELLASAAEDDTGLYFHRLALQHEGRCGEALAALAQAAGLADAPWPSPPAHAGRAERAALWLPAQRFRLGSAPGGWVPGPERWAHEEAVPEFEIDAQVVSWARFVEFAEDGGYDDARWWRPEGWAWVQAVQRRAPRHVEQLRHGVVLQRQGRLQRAAPGQPAAHLTRHEAQAWCAWAGRRLPTELEWEHAACTAANRGFVWGDVFEWAGGSARAWPGHVSPPGDLDPVPAAPAAVLRGAGGWTPRRLAHPKARRFVAAEADSLPTGFRSCAR